MDGDSSKEKQQTIFLDGRHHGHLNNKWYRDSVVKYAQNIKNNKILSWRGKKMPIQQISENDIGQNSTDMH